MLVEVYIFILLLSNLYEVTTKKRISKIKPRISSDNTIKLRQEDVDRIKAFLQTIDRFDDGSNLRDSSAYCRAFHNCYECVKSLWHPCGWCHEFGCTENPKKQCPLAGKEAVKSNVTGELKTCPQLIHNGPLLIPAGISKNVQVQIYVPDPIIYEKEIVCLIKLKQKIVHLKGLIVGDSVYCFDLILEADRLEFGDTETGTLKIIWGGAQPYSNEVPLIVYSCESFALDCESCRLIPTAYGCGWCDSTQSCVIEDKCGSDVMRWTLNRLTCEPYGKPFLTISKRYT